MNSMKQLKDNRKLKPAILTPKPALTKSQEKLIRKLETLNINRAVAEELVRASNPKAIKHWITLMEQDKK